MNYRLQQAPTGYTAFVGRPCIECEGVGTIGKPTATAKRTRPGSRLPVKTIYSPCAVCYGIGTVEAYAEIHQNSAGGWYLAAFPRTTYNTVPEAAVAFAASFQRQAWNHQPLEAPERPTAEVFANL